VLALPQSEKFCVVMLQMGTARNNAFGKTSEEAAS